MSKFSDAYGSKWFSSSDLNGKPLDLEVSRVEWRNVGHPPEEKLLLHFAGHRKPYILNRSNAKVLSAAWGELEDKWPGHYVQASVTQTAFGPGVKVVPIESPADAPF
jgi:hypothetical protein